MENTLMLVRNSGNLQDYIRQHCCLTICRLIEFLKANPNNNLMMRRAGLSRLYASCICWAVGNIHNSSQTFASVNCLLNEVDHIQSDASANLFYFIWMFTPWFQTFWCLADLSFQNEIFYLVDDIFWWLTVNNIF